MRRRKRRPITGTLTIPLRRGATRERWKMVVRMTQLMESKRGLRPVRDNEYYLRLLISRQYASCKRWFSRAGIDWRAEMGLPPARPGQKDALWTLLPEQQEKVERDPDKPVPYSPHVEEFYGGRGAHDAQAN